MIAKAKARVNSSWVAEFFNTEILPPEELVVEGVAAEVVEVGLSSVLLVVAVVVPAGLESA